MSAPGWRSSSTRTAGRRSRADAEHEDPAIGAFLDLLAGDVRAGRHVRAMPDDLARDMLEQAGRDAATDGDIEGDVDL